MVSLLWMGYRDYDDYELGHSVARTFALTGTIGALVSLALYGAWETPLKAVQSACVLRFMILDSISRNLHPVAFHCGSRSSGKNKTLQKLDFVRFARCSL